MNAKEIIEGNKLIAEFMGWKSNHNHIPLTHKYNHGNFEIWMNFDTAPIMCSDLKYHSSWDWLMPVVEKIQSLRNDKDTDELDRIHITALEVSFKNLPKNGYTKIEDMWQAVIEFIKWYNEK